MSNHSRNQKLERIENYIHIYETEIKESKFPKTDKFKKFMNKFNNLKNEGALLKEQGKVKLAIKKYKKALKYGEVVVNLGERRKFNKTWYHKTSNKIFLLQVLLIIIMFSLPGLGSVFNFHDIILSWILIGILIVLFLSFFLLLYVFFRKSPS
jgi:hypothetical protein